MNNLKSTNLETRESVVVLYNLFNGNAESEFDFDTHQTIQWLLNVIGKRYDVNALEVNQDPSEWIPKLRTTNPDLVFNIAEGYRSSAREAFYPALLEQMHLCYTGPGPSELVICLNKHLTKLLLAAVGLRVPNGYLVTNTKHILREDSKYPKIVKLNAEGSSYGLDANSVISNFSELEDRVQHLLEVYNRALIIEDFIDGDDYSLSYIEGLGVLGPIRYKLPSHAKSNIHDFDLKVFDYEAVVLETGTLLSHQLECEMRDMAQKAVAALDIRGYCRIDMRCSSNGTPYILEINGQVSFDPESSFLVAAQSHEFQLEHVVYHIIERALAIPRRDSTLCLPGNTGEILNYVRSTSPASRF